MNGARVRAEAARLRPGAALAVAALALVPFAALWAFFILGLRFDAMSTDIVLYWSQSLAWRTPFDADHVSGYPLIIALVRFLTASRIPALPLMWALAAAFNTLGALAVYSAVVRFGGKRTAFGSVVLYLLWPLVGMSYVVYPVADAAAFALLAGAVALMLSSRTHRAALLLGIAAVVHKGTWPFILALLVADAITQRRRLPWAAAILVILPLGTLWVAGMVFAHYGPLWLLSVSVPIQFASKSRLPLMDGVVGTLLYRGTRGLLKGVVLWAHVGVIVALFAGLVRGAARANRWYGIAILAAMSFLYAALNQDIIWAAVRYSRLLAIPIGWQAAVSWPGRPRGTREVFAWTAVVVLLLGSQFAYCWYMARGAV